MGHPYRTMPAESGSDKKLKRKAYLGYALIIFSIFLLILMYIYPPWVGYYEHDKKEIGYYLLMDDQKAKEENQALEVAVDIDRFLGQLLFILGPIIWKARSLIRDSREETDSEYISRGREGIFDKSAIEEFIEDEHAISDRDTLSGLNHNHNQSGSSGMGSCFDNNGIQGPSSSSATQNPRLPMEYGVRRYWDSDEDGRFIVELYENLEEIDQDFINSIRNDRSHDDDLWKLARGLENGEIQYENALSHYVYYLGRWNLSRVAWVVCGAMLHAATGNPKTAEKLFAEAEEADPENGLIYCFRFLCRCEMGEFTEALEDLNSLVSTASDSHYWPKWQSLSTRGRFKLEYVSAEEAIEDFTILIDNGWEVGEHLFNRGKAYASLKNFENAVSDFTDALQSDLVDPGPILSARGQAFYEMGLTNLALEDLDEAISMGLPEHSSEVYYCRGKIAFEREDFPKVIECFPQTSAFWGYNSRTHIMRGLSYCRVGQFELALKDINSACSEEGAMLSWRSYCLCRLKRYKDALSDVELVKKRNLDDETICEWETISLADSEVRLEWGKAYLHEGDYFSAIKEFGIALDEDHWMAESYLERGRAYLCLAQDVGKKRKKKSEIFIGSSRECDIVIKGEKVAPRHARVFRQGAVIMVEDMGSPHGTYAGYNFRRLPAHVPTPMEFSGELFLGDRAFNVHRLNEFGFFDSENGNGRNCYDRAIQDLSWALECDAEDLVALRLRSEAYSGNRMHDEAIADLTAILRLQPRDFDALGARAEAYLNTQRYELALNDCDKAIHLQPHQADFHHLRGRVYAKRGQMGAARKDYQRARELDPKKYTIKTRPKKSTEAKSEFRLPGRFELEKFFKDHVIDIVESPERYGEMGIDFPYPIALHGPPGCGKTHAANVLLNYLGWPSFTINSGSVGNMYIHETPRLIAATFEEAKAKAPAVVVIDEMDAFMCNRDYERRAFRNEEVAEYLRNLQDASENRILIIGMTNQIDMIDPALLRRGRFDHVIKVDFPSREELKECLSALLSGYPCVRGLNVNYVADALRSRPLSDAGYIVREAARLACKSKKKKIDDLCLVSALQAAIKQKSFN